MIRGTFEDGTRRPYIQGFLVFPRLDSGGYVDFLVDTGADNIVLHPEDALLMGIRYKDLGNMESPRGIGGIKHQCFVEPAIAVFAETSGRLRIYRIKAILPRPIKKKCYGRKKPNVPVPSLLGRSILDRWRIYYDQSQNRLEFIVVSADETIPAKQKTWIHD